MIRKNFFSIFYAWYLFAQTPTFATNSSSFPDGFLFGASTSAYQVEGAWNVDGKGENIWDRYTHTHPDAIRDGSNGDYAAESYYLYKQDSQLLKDIGFDVYRFSISWARILPNGDSSVINEPGIKHYNDLIDDLIEKKIQPMAIIYHWDLPQKLEDVGGWLNSSIADYIEEYADILFSRFGDRVKFWNTINEPINVVKGYASNNTVAPSLALGTPYDYIVVHNILLAHARVYRLYEKKYQNSQNGKVSITIDYETCFPKTPKNEDIEAAERYFQFTVGIFAHPIYSKDGDYPDTVKEIIYKNSMQEGLEKSRLPEFTEDEKKDLLGAFDYFSLNHYTSFICSNPYKNQSHDNGYNSVFSADMAVVVEQDPFLPQTGEQEMRVDPKAFRVAINKIADEYDNPVIYITENGYSDVTPFTDYQRIIFFQLYLEQLLDAIHKDHCNVIGYTVWSLIDNFQWIAGYQSKFGMIGVDFNSTEKTRRRKLSSYWFHDFLKTGQIPNYNTFIHKATGIYETLSELHSESGMETGTGFGTSFETGSGTDSGTGTGFGTSFETGSGSDSGTGTGFETSSGTGSETGTETPKNPLFLL